MVMAMLNSHLSHKCTMAKMIKDNSFRVARTRKKNNLIEGRRGKNVHKSYATELDEQSRWL